MPARLCPRSALGCDSSSIFLPQFLFWNPNSPCYWPGLDAGSLSRKTETFPAEFSNLSNRPRPQGKLLTQASGPCAPLGFHTPSPCSSRSPPPTYLPSTCPLHPICQGEAPLTIPGTHGEGGGRFQRKNLKSITMYPKSSVLMERNADTEGKRRGGKRLSRHPCLVMLLTPQRFGLGNRKQLFFP